MLASDSRVDSSTPDSGSVVKGSKERGGDGGLSESVTLLEEDIESLGGAECVKGGMQGRPVRDCRRVRCVDGWVEGFGCCECVREIA